MSPDGGSRAIVIPYEVRSVLDNHLGLCPVDGNNLQLSDVMEEEASYDASLLIECEGQECDYSELIGMISNVFGDVRMDREAD